MTVRRGGGWNWNYGEGGDGIELRRLDHRMDHVGQVPLLIHVVRIWPDMTTDRWILE